MKFVIKLRDEECQKMFRAVSSSCLLDDGIVLCNWEIKCKQIVRGVFKQTAATWERTPSEEFMKKTACEWGGEKENFKPLVILPQVAY